MRLRRFRAIAALVGIVLVIAAVVAVWALPAASKPAYARAVKVAFPSPVDLTAPSILYAKEYAANLRPPEPPHLVPAPKIKTIVLDRSEQMVYLYAADGSPVDRFQCATGSSYPRVGTYKVTSKKPSSSYPADGSRFYHFVIFTKSDKNTNIGFHSIPIDKDDNEIGGLGQPDSHGCVRLMHRKADFLYSWAPVGAKVVVRK
jgi:lipoprotein-anchoring transpeptidase ErfK/SrfK